MEEVLRDLEFEDAVAKWRNNYGFKDTIRVNIGETTLISNVRGGDTTIDVSNYNTFPSPPFRINVGDEIMTVTRVMGHTIEVERGAAGTRAYSHFAGDWISVV